jgi:hypothetical protein
MQLNEVFCICFRQVHFFLVCIYVSALLEMKFNCASSSAWLSRKKLQIVYESSVSIALIYIWPTELDELKYDKSVWWNTETMCCTCWISKTASSAPLLPNTAHMSPASKDVLARKIGTIQIHFTSIEKSPYSWMKVARTKWKPFHGKAQKQLSG